jgi:hypothetical protein
MGTPHANLDEARARKSSMKSSQSRKPSAADNEASVKYTMRRYHSFLHEMLNSKRCEYFRTIDKSWNTEALDHGLELDRHRDGDPSKPLEPYSNSLGSY